MTDIVQFDLQYQQQPINCLTRFTHQDRQWQLNQFNFFVSDIEVHRQGRWQSVPLQLNDRQTESVALLRLDDCATDATPAQQLQLAEPQDWQQADKIRFNLGVPFALNHANPLTQPSPLNLSSMFWSWQGGHKFLRLDLQSEQGSWAFHLGSTGCMADSAVRSPATACDKPNLFQFVVPLTNDGHIVMQLDRLLAGVELTNQTSCTFHYAEQAACQLLLDNLPTLFAD
ncbi:MbnP family copper-binding protein [Neptunicella sp.]|uniref:MbnP family copper-binding protein n=1 Tax=Neptunicella sp. TaxID=2125986 RepID=UPI003F690B82